MKLQIKNLPSEVALLKEEVIAMKRLLQDFISTPADQAEVINIDEVCKLTGYAKNTIYQLVHQGKCPYHKPEHGGRKLIFFRTEIENWLKSTKPETSKEYCERKESELLNGLKGGMN